MKDDPQVEVVICHVSLEIVLCDAILMLNVIVDTLTKDKCVGYIYGTFTLL